MYINYTIKYFYKGGTAMENSMKNYLKNLDEEKLKYVFEIKEQYNQKQITLAEAQTKLKNNVKNLRPAEIAYIEQTLKQLDPNECQKEDIQNMLQLFDGIFINSHLDLKEDHPISRYKQENKELEKIMLEIEDLIQYPIIKNQWYALYDKLLKIKIHYARKQNQLYSILEQKGFDRPTTTMWTLDDFIYNEIKDTLKLLETDEQQFIKNQSIIVADIRDLIKKEETILYPTSLDLISEQEFEEMKLGDNEIGYAWIEVESSKIKPENSTQNFQSELMTLLQKYQINNDSELNVATGKLSLEQINLIFKNMPIDLSYVDENEIVKFYTDTKHRIFPRSQNVIGRDVKNCHPQKSVHIVKEIIEKFRNGEQSKAEFWINNNDTFIYIAYFAIRDENNKFRGILEMMQDVTHIRNLEGSRTLLTWENENQESATTKENNDSTPINISEINHTTKLLHLFNQYPELKTQLIKLHPKMKVLNTPLARIMLPKATISDMSQRLEIPIEIIINEITNIIKNIKS